MRRAWWVVAAALTMACGGGLDGPPIGIDPGAQSDGGATVPPADEPVAAEKSLWPLSSGSTWTYRITDPVKGVFEKTVEVKGEMDVPGLAGVKAVAVHSVQPHLDELSWQIVSGGVVFRLREEDRKDGALARVMSWDPAVMKALSRIEAAGWRHEATVKEFEHDGTGTLLDEKEKIFVWTVAATDVTITTEAGTFTNAIELRRERGDKDDWQRTYWLVPGVGKVLEEGERREELIRYQVIE